METKELKIIVPEGHEIDWQESAKQEKIVFKKKEDTKPKSWEEYCKQQIASDKKGYYISNGDCMIMETPWNGYLKYNNWRTVLPTKELAETFLAMMQLMSLRQEWIDDWQPDWNSREPCNYKYCITGRGSSDFEIEFLSIIRTPLSFPTEEMATDFMNCFKDLLNTARSLI